MKINGSLFYSPSDENDFGSVRLDYILWCVDGSGGFAEPSPEGYTLSGTVYKNMSYMPTIKSVYGLCAGEDGFFSGSIGVAWNMDAGYVDPEKTLVFAFTGDENTIRLIPKKLPYPMGAWAQVYLNACKLGVLTMANQNEPLDVIMNRIVDNIRSGLQVVPGIGEQSFYVETTPVSGAFWGDPVSFGFLSVGFKVYNMGVIPVYFSLDGATTHGLIPAGNVCWYDFRRTSQIFFQSATSEPQIIVEAW